MYKQSNFNIVIDDLNDGDILIFNTLTNAYAIMNKATQLLYNSIENLNIEEIENVEDEKNVNLLKEHGYIVPKEADEWEMLKLRAQISKFMNRKLILTIAPTLDCNMACPYCFEKKQKIRMSKDVQEKLYDFVVNYLDNQVCEQFHVTWYGGEPLLEFDTIYDLSKKFISLCKEKKIQYTTSLITNGVLLDRNTALKLKEDCKIETAQITIDGLPEINNQRRILIDGRNSFDLITNNIDNCKDLLKIYVRINIDKENMDNLPQLTDYFLQQRGWNTNPYFYIAPVVDYENNCGYTSCISGEEYGELDYHVISHRSRNNPEAVKSELYPQIKYIACTAEQFGNYVIDPNGDMYTCMNVIGNKDSRIGNIRDPISFNNTYAKWLLYQPAEKCRSCNLFPICAGGCPYEFLLRGEPSCDKRIYTLKERLKIAYSEHIKKRSVS